MNDIIVAGFVEERRLKTCGYESDGIGWYWMVLDGIGWHWMALDGIGWHRMASDGIGWHRMASDGIGWHWMVSIVGGDAGFGE